MKMLEKEKFPGEDFLMRAQIRFLVIALAYTGFIAVLSVGVGPLPGLAPLLNFSKGVYANAREKSFENLHFSLSGLKAPVTVVFDQNQVPHLFAKNESDLFFAQGFVMAKYRLFQMDVMTRAGGAELSEMMGPRTQELDRFFIQFGLRKSVQESLALVQKDADSWKALQAYTDGINAWINTLTPTDWPVEYKVLQFPPKPFTPQRVLQLLKIMSFDLAGRSYDLPFTQIARHLGFEKAVDLFPDFFSSLLPFDSFDDLFHDLHGATDNAKSLKAGNFNGHITSFPSFLHPVQTNGSNSWVISKGRSTAGVPLLANDTHLGLKAPSVWFENRLHVDGPEGLDVYGASFPGAPLVILGMNQNFSWGATNGTIDVLDWFEVEFKDETSPEYKVDGQWLTAVSKEDVLKVRGQNPDKIKTLWTDFGPVLHREGKWGLTARWSGHVPSNEARIFYQMDKAHSVENALEILKDYKTPIQNFSLADHDHIALVTAGIYPVRTWGRGREVADGTQSKNNWQGFARAGEELTSKDPSGGVLHSANQRPFGSEMRNYLGWDFEEPFRGLRIRQILSETPKVNVDLFREMQNEDFNELAFYFFQVVEREHFSRSLKEEDKTHFETLRGWDFRDRAASVATSQFYAWFRTIEEHFWKEPLQFQTEKFYPKRARTLAELYRLSREKPSEDFYRFLRDTFKESKPEEQKIWGETQPTTFKHVARFPGFESMTLPTPGSKFSLNSNKGSHGGAWRFIAEMSTPPRAWAQIPGSTEGNPLSPHYADHIRDWAQGKMREVHFVSKEELLKNPLCVWELSP
jgi:penicillin amidase